MQLTSQEYKCEKLQNDIKDDILLELPLGKIAGLDKNDQGIHDFPRETIERNKKINEAIPPMRNTS